MQNPNGPLSKCEMPLRSDGAPAHWTLWVLGGPPGSGGRSPSLAESNWKGVLEVKLLPSTFPTAYYVPDFSREHLRATLINIKTKGMPEEGRKVSVATSKYPETGPGAWVPFSTGMRRGPHCGGRKGASGEQRRHISFLLCSNETFHVGAV